MKTLLAPVQLEYYKNSSSWNEHYKTEAEKSLYDVKHKRNWCTSCTAKYHLK